MRLLQKGAEPSELRISWNWFGPDLKALPQARGTQEQSCASFSERHARAFWLPDTPCTRVREYSATWRIEWTRYRSFGSGCFSISLALTTRKGLKASCCTPSLGRSRRMTGLAI